eukprot:jgi/Undpi1/2843/HiC_scaffold_14.g06220.m1
MAVDRAFDYSKWDHIDISDDESDCHPNIEKETWFRLKTRTSLPPPPRPPHAASPDVAAARACPLPVWDLQRRQREEKEQEQNARKAELGKGIKKGVARLAELEKRAAMITAEGGEVEGEDPEALAAEAAEVTEALALKQKEIESIDRNKTWNWENMCHVTEERTIINKSAESEAKDTMARSSLPPKLAAALGAKPKDSVPGPGSSMQEVHSYSEFVEIHEDVMERYCDLRSMDATRDFLREHGDILFADHCQSYLLLSCLQDEMNGKHERMKLVARQSQLLSSITELAVSLRRPPQDVVPALFLRLNEDEHAKRFKDGVQDFVSKVQKRAVEKRKEMDAEEEQETTTVELSKEERMGPGGLDPVEVFATLPEEMQIAFEAKDTPMLKKALLAMTEEERKYHMKRCEDSGLWVPGAGGSRSAGEDEEDEDFSEGDEEGEEAAQAGGEGTGEGPKLSPPAPPSPTGAGSGEASC